MVLTATAGRDLQGFLRVGEASSPPTGGRCLKVSPLGGRELPVSVIVEVYFPRLLQPPGLHSLGGRGLQVFTSQVFSPVVPQREDRFVAKQVAV